MTSERPKFVREIDEVAAAQEAMLAPQTLSMWGIGPGPGGTMPRRMLAVPPGDLALDGDVTPPHFRIDLLASGNGILELDPVLHFEQDGEVIDLDPSIVKKGWRPSLETRINEIVDARIIVEATHLKLSPEDFRIKFKEACDEIEAEVLGEMPKDARAPILGDVLLGDDDVSILLPLSKSMAEVLLATPDNSLGHWDDMDELVHGGYQRPTISLSLVDVGRGVFSSQPEMELINYRPMSPSSFDEDGELIAQKREPYARRPLQSRTWFHSGAARSVAALEKIKLANGLRSVQIGFPMTTTIMSVLREIDINSLPDYVPSSPAYSGVI